MKTIELTLGQHVLLAEDLGGIVNPETKEVVKPAFFENDLSQKLRYNLHKVFKQCVKIVNLKNEESDRLVQLLGKDNFLAQFIDDPFNPEGKMQNPNWTEYQNKMNEFLSIKETLNIPDTLNLKEVDDIKSTVHYNMLYELIEMLEAQETKPAERSPEEGC